MQHVYYDMTSAALVDFQELQQTLLYLQPVYERIRHAAQGYHASSYDFVYTPFDQEAFRKIIQLAYQKNALNVSMMIVAGIGGSNIGFLAIHHAVQGLWHNESTSRMKVYCADTVDPEQMSCILKQAEQVLQSNSQILVVLITKSGTTLETLAHAEVLTSLLMRYRPEQWQEYVVVISDEHSPLWNRAQHEGISTLALPPAVGGRFSIFTPVALFPLALLGCHIEELLEGARQSVRACSVYAADSNFAALSASVLFNLYQRNIRIHDFFVFSQSLQSLGGWYRQLIGESLGKEYDVDNKKVNIGITPTVSLGSTDLHSVGQLYLAGPYDKVTTFVTVEESTQECFVPSTAILEKNQLNIHGKSYSFLMNSIALGTLRAFMQQERPHMLIRLNKKAPFALGHLMMTKMIEIVYLAHLFNIDPFDQPHVELYKREVKSILLSK